MNVITNEVNNLIAEMEALDEFNDDVFIQYFEKVEDLQERLAEFGKTNKLSPEEYKGSEEYKGCTERLAESFEKLKGKLTFCTH